MKTELLLYTRKDCCLCDEMKSTVSRVAGRVPFALEEDRCRYVASVARKVRQRGPGFVHQWSQGVQVSANGQGIEKVLKREAVSG